MEQTGGTPEAPIQAIKVGVRYRKDLGDLGALAASIREVGLLHPIVVTRDLALVAGERRLMACAQLGWKAIPVNFVDLAEIVKGEFAENAIRKDFLPSEAVAIQRALEPTIKAAAETRKAVGQKSGGRGKKKLGGNLPPSIDTRARSKTRDKVAAYVGKSGRTLDKAAAVVEAAENNPERFADLVEEMDKTGKVDKAHRQMKQRARDDELRQKPLVWPSGKYPIIYADPPWRYEHAPMESPSRAIENQYPTMSLEEICALRVRDIATDDAVLFLWATAPKLAESMQVIEAWGFEYRTCMCWVKDKIGMGYYVRNQHELLLIARRGEPAKPAEARRPSSVMHAPRTKHSAKPAEFAAAIEAMYPDWPKVELFSRSHRKGWAAWGNQAHGAAA